MWSQAAALADRTPESRNRYVDFLRPVSIGAVVVGHWLIAAPHIAGGRIQAGHMLDLAPWTQWLTWAFQVMPVFFIVGGFANGISWRAAQRSGRDYGDWLISRLRRLVGPLLPLILLWAVIGAVARSRGVSAEFVKVGSQMALIPIWFLAVYVMVVVAVPATHAAWKRFGLGSFWALAVGAVMADAAFFGGVRPLGWLNYAFVWLAVHQLGYAWLDGHLTGPRKALLWSVGGLAVLIGLVTIGPYPLSMVGVPGEAVSNSLPPKIALLALGCFQGGLLISLEAPVRRWLKRRVPWTMTVVVNGMIMTIFLWHLTAMTLLVGLALALGGIGLTVEPGSGVWWASRPIWMAVYASGLAVLSLLFARFERPSARAETPAAVWRQIAGAALVCFGLALLALDGV